MNRGPNLLELEVGLQRLVASPNNYRPAMLYIVLQNLLDPWGNFCDCRITYKNFGFFQQYFQIDSTREIIVWLSSIPSLTQRS